MDTELVEDQTTLSNLPSRRRLLSGFVAALATARAGLDAAYETLAKSKRAKGKKKGRKKKPHGNKPKPRVSPPGSYPPPPPRPPTGPGRCDAVSGDNFGGSRRWAQTFLPPHGGQLNAVQLYLRENPADFFLSVEIRTVDAAGVPTSMLLAETAALHVPATARDDPPQEVTATFAPPMAVTAGQRLALVITGPPVPDNEYAIHANGGGNHCNDGKLFLDSDANDNFTTSGTGDDDLVYVLFIAK